MKKLSLLVLSFILMFSLVRCSFSKVDMDNAKAGNIKFIYADTNVDEPLTDEEFKTVKEILNNKIINMTSSIPSCGFDPNVSITIDGTVYAIACDRCEVIKVMNYTIVDNYYINLSDEENEKFREIFENHGGFFPCV